MILGIVGSAGVGKTTAANFFIKNGAYIISSDQIVKELYQQPSIINKIITVFGAATINDEGNFDKKKLRNHVFQDYKNLQKLELILWPKLKIRIIKKIKTHKKHSNFIVIDCAILINIGLIKFVDKILVIIATEKQQITRIKIRDHVHDKQVLNLLAIQKARLKMPHRPDFIIYNDKTLDFLYQQLQKIITTINFVKKT